jgi:predicted PurR-regulated permease PerM
LEVIPSLGSILATIPAAVLALVFGSVHFPEKNHLVFT